MDQLKNYNRSTTVAPRLMRLGNVSRS